MPESLTILVLGGGPDNERSVSLKSASAVAVALLKAGHTVIESDIMPDDPSPLDIACDVVFPVLHGPFGEGGPLQAMLENKAIPYVGCGPAAARIAMDKIESKRLAASHDVPVAPQQVLASGNELTLEPPLVIKPIADGSSVGVTICKTTEQAAAARAALHEKNTPCFAEQFIEGRELTVGIVGPDVLPPIMIVPGVEFYDYDAKYERNDTRYEFDIDVPAETLDSVQRHARTVFDAIGCRHLSRVDFIVDEGGTPWFLEVNTMPGFTDHSLLPMAAARTGMEMPALCDRLVRLALADASGR